MHSFATKCVTTEHSVVNYKKPVQCSKTTKFWPVSKNLIQIKQRLRLPVCPRDYPLVTRGCKESSLHLFFKASSPSLVQPRKSIWTDARIPKISTFTFYNIEMAIHRALWKAVLKKLRSSHEKLPKKMRMNHISPTVFSLFK